MNCWEKVKCKDELRNHCAVYVYDAGKECIAYMEEEKKFPKTGVACSCFVESKRTRA